MNALLQLMGIASPALRVGAFSHSEGLESEVKAGKVTNEAEAGNWLLDQLQLSLARADLAVAAPAFAAWRRADFTRVAELNDSVCDARESAELRQQSE